MKNTFKHLAAAALLLSACSPEASFALDVPGNIAVVNVGCVEMDAYTQNHTFDRTPVVVRAGVTNNFQVAPSLTVGTSPLVREWEVEIVKPTHFTANLLSLTNTLTRLGLLSAAPGTVSAQILGSDGTWKNSLSDSGGRLVLPSIRAMPAGTALSVGSINYATGEMLLDLPRWGRHLGATNTLASATSIVARVRVAWTPQGYSGGQAFAPLPLENPSGPILCSIFADMDGSGAWTPGEPYGASAEYTYQWGQSSFLVGVGLSDTSPSVMRFDIKGMMADNTFSGQTALNDRGKLGMAKYPNVAHLVPGTEMDTAPDGVRLRIVESKVNNVSYYQVSTTTRRYANDVVFDEIVNTAATPYFTEALLLAKDRGALKNDLDWGNIGNAAGQLNVSYANAISVTYRVVVGNGPVDVIATNNAFATMFVNAFESGSEQTKAVPITIPTGTNSQRRVAFSWRHDCPTKAYPAFRLRIYKRGSSDTLIYDSGIRSAPPRDATGIYRWSPINIWVGERTPKAEMFSNNADYYWTVSMLDAKHTTVNSDETKSYFRVNVQ